METKVCEVCGCEYTRGGKEVPGRWAQRKYCSKVCAGSAKRKAPTPMVAQTKTCLRCGATFSRRLGEQSSNYNKRCYCSKSCARSKPRSGDGFVHRYIEPNCECGERATSLVWFIQLTASMEPIIQCMEVCEDCWQMWLEDGATMERPVIEKPARRGWKEPDYFAPAHVMQWHRKQGGRP